MFRFLSLPAIKHINYLDIVFFFRTIIRALRTVSEIRDISKLMCSVKSDILANVILLSFGIEYQMKLLTSSFQHCLKSHICKIPMNGQFQ